MTSTCIFGSFARRRTDALSDKDILIAGPSEAHIVDAAQPYSTSGWSISKFTHQQLRDMASNGSLFLQHLKQEGAIIRDDDGFLGSIVANFRLRLEYGREARESFALLREITGRQATYWSSLCAADIAYGAIRNIAILQLAATKTYLFDYSELIDHFAFEAKLSSTTRDALLALRTLKHAYRKRLTTLAPEPILINALAGADQIFGLSRHETEIGCMTSGYGGLRKLELYLVSRADPRELDLLLGDDPLVGAWELIRNPRGYRPPRGLADAAWLEEQYWWVRNRFPAVAQSVYP